jgi:DTW domain-containing protein YfiP
MHAAEYPKPTNTARLIQAALPQTHIFLWQGSTPPPELATLLGDRRFTPYMVFPHGQSGLFERLRERPWRPETMPAFLILDGTWKQTRKMFLRSPYLRGLPWVTIIPEAPSAYALRQQRCATHLSTVEVAIALLQQVGDSPDSRRLAAYFQRFTAYSWAVRYGRPLPTLLPAAPFA